MQGEVEQATKHVTFLSCVSCECLHLARSLAAKCANCAHQLVSTFVCLLFGAGQVVYSGLLLLETAE